MILLVIILVGSGTYFDYDLIHGISTPMFSFFKITPKELLSISSINGFLNIFAAPVGGYLISSLGAARAGIYLTATIYFGLFISYLSTLKSQFWLVRVGFLLIGVGNESLINTQMTAIENWFSGRFLSFAVGIKFSSFMLLGALSDYICPYVYIRSRSLQDPFFLTAMVCFLGFLASLCYFFIEIRVGGWEEEEAEPQGIELFDLRIQPNKTHQKNKNAKENKVRKYPAVFSEENSMIASHPRTETKQSEKDIFGIKFSDLGKMNALYWFTTSIYCLLPHTFLKISQMLTDMIKIKYDYPFEEIKSFTVIPKLSCLVFLPFTSLLIVRLGKKGLLLCLSAIVGLASLASLYTISNNQSSMRLRFSLMSIGLYYAIYTSCIWSSMAIALPRKAVGLGYGLASSIQSLFSGLIYHFMGRLTKARTPKAYGNALLLLFGVNAVGLGLALVLYFYDVSNERVLDLEENSEEVGRFRELNDLRFNRT